MLCLEMGDLAGQRLDDRVVAVCAVRRWRFRAGLVAEPFDPGAEVGVSVEERVRDPGFALDGLEGNELVSSSSAQLGGCLTDCGDLFAAGWLRYRAGCGGTRAGGGWR